MVSALRCDVWLEGSVIEVRKGEESSQECVCAARRYGD
jgi:hypothetical protein